MISQGWVYLQLYRSFSAIVTLSVQEASSVSLLLKLSMPPMGYANPFGCVKIQVGRTERPKCVPLGYSGYWRSLILTVELRLRALAVTARLLCATPLPCLCVPR